MKNSLVVFILFYLISFLISMQTLIANCDSNMSAELILNVTQCTAIDPEQQFLAADEKYAWIYELALKEREAVLNSYRGLVLVGPVLKGEATSTEGDIKSLMGKQLRAFVAGNNQKCADFEGRKFSAKLQQQCCDGAGVSPCLLKTSYSLSELKVEQEFLTLTMKQVLQRYQNASSENKKAISFFKQKDFVSLVNLLGPRVVENWQQNLLKNQENDKSWLQPLKNFKILETNNSNEVDLYLFAYAYRELGEYKHSIVILERMRDLWNQDRLLGAYELLGKEALLLLAKNFARDKQDWPAVELLELFRKQPERFEKQLERALKDADFGWIKATKAFQEFEAKLAPAAKADKQPFLEESK
ncbi:MAG: hypothetical protein KBD78_10020 [Oligoflexales bacterium]|nr:hypothetical protein [Oligoflexales bacterium]